MMPKIIQAFSENPQENIVQFTGNQLEVTAGEEFYFKMTRYECSLYNQLESPALKSIYFNCLTINQVAMHYSKPEIAAMAFEAMYQSVKM